MSAANGSKTWLTKLAGAEFKVMRLNDAPPLTLSAVDTPELTVDYLRAHLTDDCVRYNHDVENLLALFLSTRRHVIGFSVITNGTLESLLLHPRELFKPAIVLAASAIVIAHNHPSGDPTPSESDIKITCDLIRAGHLLKIDLLDHIILGRQTPDQKGWCSMREIGYFTADMVGPVARARPKIKIRKAAFPELN